MATCGQCRAAIQPGVQNCWNCGITLSGRDLETIPGTGAYAGQPQQDPMIGRSVIDQFIIRAKIGEGGMASVYVAEQPAVGRNAVIKILHPWLSRDPTIAARFNTEARAAARLQNPHIVSIYNYGKMADGTLFLAMEHLHGCTLAQLIQAEGRLEPARAVAIATQCCEALTEAHRRGVVHRDLKPSNIMMVSRGGPDYVKVLDFGIATLDDREAPTGGGVVGTPRYMAPEQLSGNPVDARADLYALGLIIYEMLTGRPPFVAQDAAGYMHKHLNEQPPSLMQACPGILVPPALEACVIRTLAKAPHQRPQRASTLADELWTALMATVDSSHIPAPTPRRPRPPRGLVVASVVVASVFALTAASGAAYYWTRAGGEPEEPDNLGAALDPVATPEATAAVSGPNLPPDIAKLGPPSAEKKALMAKSIAELETELQRVTVLSGKPRDVVALSMKQYRDAIVSPPDGVDSTWYRKSMLVELILAWRSQGFARDPGDRSQDELEAVFLAMESPLDSHTRAQMLNELKHSAAGKPNPEWAVRVMLMQWIDAYGADDSDVELEIIEEP